MEQDKQQTLSYLNASEYPLAVNTTNVNIFATADDLFNRLGYEKYETKTKIKYYLSKDDEDLIILCFNLKTKRLTVDCRGESLDIDDIQAINLKVRELGWYEQSQ